MIPHRHSLYIRCSDGVVSNKPPTSCAIWRSTGWSHRCIHLSFSVFWLPGIAPLRRFIILASACAPLLPCFVSSEPSTPSHKYPSAVWAITAPASICHSEWLMSTATRIRRWMRRNKTMPYDSGGTRQYAMNLVCQNTTNQLLCC